MILIVGITPIDQLGEFVTSSQIAHGSKSAPRSGVFILGFPQNKKTTRQGCPKGGVAHLNTTINHQDGWGLVGASEVGYPLRRCRATPPRRGFRLRVSVQYLFAVKLTIAFQLMPYLYVVHPSSSR